MRLSCIEVDIGIDVQMCVKQQTNLLKFEFEYK